MVPASVEPGTRAALSVLATMSAFSPSSPAWTVGLTNEQFPLPRKQEIGITDCWSPSPPYNVTALEEDGPSVVAAGAGAQLQRSACYVGANRALE